MKSDCPFSVGRTWLMAGMLLAICGHSAADIETRGGTAEAEERLWRKPEADGVNSMYVFLRLHGVAVSYEELEAAFAVRQAPQDPASLLDLKEIARQFGLQVELVRCLPGAELYDRFPAVTLLDSARGGNGEFVLLFQRSLRFENLSLMYGGNVWMGDLPLDDFCRDWTGVVLTASAPDPTNRVAIVSWIGISMVLMIGYAWWRLRALPA